MAGYTYFSIGSHGALEGRVYWESQSNGTAANSSSVYARVEVRRNDGYTTYGTWTGDVNINWNAQTFSQYAEVGSSWVSLKDMRINVGHENDGTKTCFIGSTVHGPSGTSMEGVTINGSINATLDTIPRYTSITQFTVSKYNEDILEVAWKTADTIDYAWYSTNNGSTWTGVDVVDGTSGTFDITGLSPGTSYNCKLRVRRKDSQLTTDSSTVVQSTYALPTQSLYSKTETEVTIKWSIDTPAEHLWYSKDNGSTWVDLGVISGTKVGDYTITGLTANTTYNFKTRLKRANVVFVSDTTKLTVTTYDYPKVSGVGTGNLLIGDTQALTLYNPLNHNVTVKMYQNNTSGTELYSGTASGTSTSFTPVLSTLYASIPNSTSGNCVYSVIYGNSTKTTTQYTYSIRGTETPIFNNFTYADTNYASKTGNNQVLVQGLSNLRVTISNENKMIARHSASGNKYTAACENRSGQVDYSSTENVTIDLGTIDTSGTKAISVSAYDSRNLYTTVIQEALVVPYSKPTIVSSATRLNNFENQTTLKVNGVFSKVTVDEVDKNTITNVKYRVREVGGEWGSLTAITFTTNDNKYTCSDVTLDLDNTKSFEIEVQTTDTMEQVTTGSVIVNIGIPSFFIKKTGGFESYGTSKVNGLLQVENEEVSDTLKAKFITPTFYTLDLSSLSTSNFYPITFPKDEKDLPLDCEIHSPSSGSSAAYNQNVIHFRLLTSGWNDTPVLFNVYEYGAFDFNEITIGSIGKSNNSAGTLNEGECIWLRGGMEYRFVSNFKPVLHTSDYSPPSTSGVTYSVGTNYNGGTNAGITTLFTPKTTLTANGSYFANAGGKFNGTATNATKASQNVGGQDLTTLYPRAGCMGASSFDNVGSGGKLQRSGLYAESIGGTWYNLINVRHRNGESDGVSFGMQLRSVLTSQNGTLQMRQQSNGTWGNWGSIFRCHNLYNNTTGTTGTITLTASSANFSFLDIYFKNSQYGDESFVRVYSPNGKKVLIFQHIVFRSSATTILDDRRVNISGTSITTVSGDDGYGRLNTWNNALGSDNKLNIIRVDGWL